MRKALLAAVLLCGCPTPGDPADDDDTATPDAPVVPGFTFGDEVACDDPTDGFARLTNEADQRGLAVTLRQNTPFAPPCPIGGGVVATDLDDDGDVDVILGDYPYFPRVFANDGTGHFSEVGAPYEVTPSDPPGERSFWATADLDGDRLPELILFGTGGAHVARNTGGLRWRGITRILEPESPRPVFQTLALGDLDGDHDTDLLLPVVHLAGHNSGDEGSGQDQGWDPGYDYLLMNRGLDDDGVVQWEVTHDDLSPTDEPGFAQVSTFTDFDADGDLDVFVPSEFGWLGVPSALYRNDGPDGDDRLRLEDVAPELGADLEVGAMGIDSADLNGDGRLDYCVSNFGPLRCLLSYGDEGWIESAAAIGLDLPDEVPDWQWSAYTVEFADLDHDGYDDVVVVAGPPNRDDEGNDHPDALWRGLPDLEFEDWSQELGFDSSNRHFAAATADFDGDGWLDVVVSGTEGPAELWMNRCGDGAWLDVALDGPGTARDAFGARVVATAGERTWIRELHSLRALGQGPRRVHFGFGDVDVLDSLRVEWPGGDVSEATGVPTRRFVTVAHPARLYGDGE